MYQNSVPYTSMYVKFENFAFDSQTKRRPARRFVDCKDKNTLFKYLLSSFYIELKYVAYANPLLGRPTTLSKSRVVVGCERLKCWPLEEVYLQQWYSDDNSLLKYPFNHQGLGQEDQARNSPERSNRIPRCPASLRRLAYQCRKDSDVGETCF